MALNQSHESGNNGDKLWLLTSMQPGCYHVAQEQRTKLEGLPHVKIFTANIKTYKFQN
jgi:hypothetical protein